MVDVVDPIDDTDTDHEESTQINTVERNKKSCKLSQKRMKLEYIDLLVFS